MKSRIQHFLQRVLGLKNYLRLFSWYKIKTLKSDKGENDFFHFIDLIPSDKLALDIGANIGIMSYYLCKRTRPNNVYAFEPIPSNISALHWIKKRFGLDNMQIVEAALGNANGSIEMVLPVVDKVKKQGLSHVVTEEITEFNEGIRFTAESIRLDDFTPLIDQEIGAIKIDVENFEYQVFLGATELLRKHHPMIYCELWDNQNRYNCFDLLRSLGYTVKVKEGNSLVNFDEKNHTTQNFFFVYE
ncbi:MAG: FkbM family methyltransferase [Bacteroidia bacterium]|nr:FkbM family methyltransferase [Bacteroidia bacterium]